jgi:hypothetical protein
LIVNNFELFDRQIFQKYQNFKRVEVDMKKKKQAKSIISND